MTLNLLGGLYVRTNELSKSESSLVSALSIQERKLGDNDGQVALTLSTLAELYSLTGMRREDGGRRREEERRGGRGGGRRGRGGGIGGGRRGEVY
jgi:hypothetical protein